MLRYFAAVTLLAITPSLALAQATHGGTPDQQKACQSDVARHCRAVIQGGDFAILDCLKANRPKLSKACEKVLKDNGQ
jgi:hypothetical protein